MTKQTLELCYPYCSKNEYDTSELNSFSNKKRYIFFILVLFLIPISASAKGVVPPPPPIQSAATSANWSLKSFLNLPFLISTLFGARRLSDEFLLPPANAATLGYWIGVLSYWLISKKLRF